MGEENNEHGVQDPMLGGDNHANGGSSFPRYETKCEKVSTCRGSDLDLAVREGRRDAINREGDGPVECSDSLGAAKRITVMR